MAYLKWLMNKPSLGLFLVFMFVTVPLFSTLAGFTFLYYESPDYIGLCLKSALLVFGPPAGLAAMMLLPLLFYPFYKRVPWK